eukprot:jgi/Chlat1/3001/Chrsp2S04716
MAEALMLQLSNSANSNGASERLRLLEARLTGAQTAAAPDASGLVLPDLADDELPSTSDSDDDSGAAFHMAHNAQRGTKRTMSKRTFSKEEDCLLLEGVRNNGQNWDVVSSSCLPERTPAALKRRYKRLLRDGVLSTPPSVGIQHDDSGDARLTRSRKARLSAQLNEESRHSTETDVRVASITTRICAPSTAKGCQTTVSLEKSHASLEQQRQAFEQERLSWRSQMEATQQQSTRAQEALQEAEQQNQKLVAELQKASEREQCRELKVCRMLADLVVEAAKKERMACRVKLRQDQVMLGTIGVQRAGPVLSEVWEDGQSFVDLNAKQVALTQQREAVERLRKQLKKPPTVVDGEAVDENGAMTGQDQQIAEEIYKIKLANLKKEEDYLLKERERLDAAKSKHIRELKRVRDEDASRFNTYCVLNKRYVMLNLLGKGGFSEVYKAYDLVDLREVACKIHQLNMQWNEAKKQSYVRHAMREYNIHRNLEHPSIVRLHDIFEIDTNTFATVLEYCEGNDLDAHLKANHMLSEREARTIVFSALAYLNDPSRRVIHYDLKPGNILFDVNGRAKLTDFGLSKIVEEIGIDSMELTSQGAGTYWYLPPECFEMSGKPPRISSKVDVWAAGVILYQMLYGRRPFGHDLSQEKILREETIVRSRGVEFPPKPVVSNEAKEFIRRCLTSKQQDRPDVLAAATDPYLAIAKARRSC